MRSLILIAVLILSTLYQACADDIELSAFETQGIRPKQTNGTVSEQIPFMVSIRLVSEEINRGFGIGHYCGGVIVSKQHILTVATCVQRSANVLDPASIEIVAGTRYRYDETSARKYSVNRIFVHPDFTVANMPNNVAVIYLNQEIPSDDPTISTISMSERSAAIGENLQIFGWGTPLINNGHRELQTGRVTVLHRTTCPQSFILRFCAGPAFYGGCQGDDGGAVVADGLLYGLVDYRSTTYCTAESTPPTHLYVDVFEHRNWILTTFNGDLTPSTTLGGSKRSASAILILCVISMLQL